MDVGTIELVGNLSGWVVAIITLALTVWRDRRASRTEHDESVRQSQRFSDKLDALSREIAKMQATLSAIVEREDAHRSRLTECTTRIDDHERRIKRIETRCDERKN